MVGTPGCCPILSAVGLTPNDFGTSTPVERIATPAPQNLRLLIFCFLSLPLTAFDMPKSPVICVKTITGNDVVDERGSREAGHRDSEVSSVGQLNEKFRSVANLNCRSAF